MIPKALVDKHVHKRIDAGIEGDNNDADDVGDVSVLLTLKVIIQHVDDQHWKPSDAVHSANLKTNESMHACDKINETNQSHYRNEANMN